MRYLWSLLVLMSLFFLGTLSSCNKQILLSKSNLTFSSDTLVFDTVFTTVGSTTKSFKIYNPDQRTLRIDEIELMGGSNSVYRINVDGIPGTKHQDVLLEAKDSLFIFVEVTLEANNITNPLIIEDSVRFRTNGKDQYVKLAAWGQDAYFHYSNFQSEIYDFNEGVWPNDKPHVIYGAAIVDSAKTLTIPAGTKVHLHKNALLYVYKGSLQIEGQLGNEVIFLGDRLEQDYQDVSGQYYGIYLHEALPSNINYAILKNGTSGVHLYSEDPANTSYTLTIQNTQIYNQARYGIFIFAGAKVKAKNCLISQNGTHALLVLQGGSFNFNHCNLLGYGASTNPAVGISNYYNDYQLDQTLVSSIDEGVFKNCVIYGNLDTEIAMDTIQMAGVQLNFDFDYSVFKSEITYTDAFYGANLFWNLAPLFTNTTERDFHFGSNSSLSNKGVSSSVFSDILGQARNNPPDIGAIEVQ
jgi:Right handed beta helix region